MNEDKKSPLKTTPLRQAGQGVQDRILNMVFSNLFVVFIVPAFFFIIMLMQWVQYFTSQSTPILSTVFFVMYTAYAWHRWRKIAPQLGQLKLGRNGEKIVGETLEQLRANGFSVFHDVPAVGESKKKFNLDHVLIWRKGIFVIETKTWSKHHGGDDKISLVGGRLNVGGYELDSNFFVQPKAESDWLADFFNKKTGKSPRVQTILVFPGWFIEPGVPVQTQSPGVLLLNPKSLGPYLATWNEVLSGDDANLFGSLLDDYIRNFKEE